MTFFTKRRRQPPAVIIVSMIDILVVLLIFMMVTTTFKHQPAVKLALPESKVSREGVSENSLALTVATTAPYFWLGQVPITLEKLEAELRDRVKQNPQLALNLRVDKEVPFGQLVQVMDALKAAGVTGQISGFASPRTK